MTGSRGYCGNDGSVRDRSHIQKTVRAPFTVRECRQVSQSPTIRRHFLLRAGSLLSAVTRRSSELSIPYFLPSASTISGSSG